MLDYRELRKSKELLPKAKQPFQVPLLQYAIALVALTLMEIVLGIDNIVFIAIVTGRLPKEQQASGRRWGLGLAPTMATVSELIEISLSCSDQLSGSYPKY